MFALALWDARTRTLVAARDRAGEKPLYYARTARGLLLASEIKALLVAPDVSREVDLEALDQFLTYEYVITPRTIFAAVRRLPAAHYLVYRNGELAVTRYWRPPAVARTTWGDEEAAAALRETLGRAVARQMMSDVPLGAFLSGGIDSSAIVALMTEAAGARTVAGQHLQHGLRRRQLQRAAVTPAVSPSASPPDTARERSSRTSPSSSTG